MKRFFQYEVFNDFFNVIVTLDIEEQLPIPFVKRFLKEDCGEEEHKLYGLESRLICSFVNNSAIVVGDRGDRDGI